MSRAAGFTLAEALVALLLLGLAAAALAPAAARRLPGYRLDAATAAVLADLRQAQLDATLGWREAAFRGPGDAVRAGDGGLRHRAGALIGVAVRVEGSDPADPRAIRFLPGGWSPGGRVVLESGGRRSEVVVDWPLGTSRAVAGATR